MTSAGEEEVIGLELGQELKTDMCYRHRYEEDRDEDVEMLTNEKVKERERAFSLNGRD